MKKIAVLLLPLACTACSITEPVVVIEESGRVLKGTVT